MTKRHVPTKTLQRGENGSYNFDVPKKRPVNYLSIGPRKNRAARRREGLTAGSVWKKAKRLVMQEIREEALEKALEARAKADVPVDATEAASVVLTDQIVTPGSQKAQIEDPIQTRPSRKLRNKRSESADTTAPI